MQILVTMNDSHPPTPPDDRDPEETSGEFDHIYEIMDELDGQIAEYQSSLSGPRAPVSESPETKAVSPSVVPPLLLDPHDPRLKEANRWKRKHVILLVLTFVSCFYKGLTTGDIPGIETHPRGMSPTPEMWSAMIWNGIQYSFAVMLILFAHEMGHYLQAVRYHVAASPPFFIPMPILPFGTMGAVIVQRSGYGDRKRLFDIGISGPLAGLVFALPIAWLGALQSEVRSRLELNGGSLEFGDPLIMQWMYEWVHGPLGTNDVIMLNPLLFAGWVGIFITALNLIPIGQLDGGHVLYALIGKRAHTVAMLLVYAILGYMIFTNNFQYVLMLILIVLFGPRHPPTADDEIELGWFRSILGWLTLAFIVIGFTPMPLVYHP